MDRKWWWIGGAILAGSVGYMVLRRPAASADTAAQEPISPYILPSSSGGAAGDFGTASGGSTDTLTAALLGFLGNQGGSAAIDENLKYQIDAETKTKLADTTEQQNTTLLDTLRGKIGKNTSLDFQYDDKGNLTGVDTMVHTPEADLERAKINMKIGLLEERNQTKKARQDLQQAKLNRRLTNLQKRDEQKAANQQAKKDKQAARQQAKADKKAAQKAKQDAKKSKKNPPVMSAR